MNNYHSSDKEKIELNSEKQPFAEVIESNLESFTAQSWQWDHFPKFGGLVIAKTDYENIIGCVTKVTTGSDDPIRHPFTYKKTESELKAEQPQIFEFLKTTFTVQIIGYENIKSKICYQLIPQRPVKIHSFVEYPEPELYKNFYKKANYLHIIFQSLNNINNADELLLAIINEIACRKLLTKELFENFCDTFSIITGNDYRRLKSFLSRVEELPCFYEKSEFMPESV